MNRIEAFEEAGVQWTPSRVYVTGMKCEGQGLSIMRSAAKKFWATSSNVLYNYFDSLSKLFSKLSN